MALIHETGQPASQTVHLHPATEVGTVTLKVADLPRSLAFYTSLIGLQLLAQDEQAAWLGVKAGSAPGSAVRPILRLEEVPGARRPPPSATGLYHAAILLPDRRSLAIKVAQLAAAGQALGQGDHVVSEAFYLSDPDGNGLELYRDRPRAEWSWENGQVRMASDPIDLEGLMAEVREDDPAQADPALPYGTRLGHLHLRVGNIEAAEAFYHGLLGFDVTARWPGALFMSAGGYHHHLGLNTWQSRNGKPPSEPAAGLREFSLALPDRAELDRLAARIAGAGGATEAEGDAVVLRDPFENQIRLIARDQPAQV